MKHRYQLFTPLVFTDVPQEDIANSRREGDLTPDYSSKESKSQINQHVRMQRPTENSSERTSGHKNSLLNF